MNVFKVKIVVKFAGDRRERLGTKIVYFHTIFDQCFDISEFWMTCEMICENGCEYLSGSILIIWTRQ
jgi:hypothetical protein